MWAPRILYPGAIYHVGTRGNDGMPIVGDDWDRHGFFGIVATTIRKFGWKCHAYCLMTNHYHLVIETPEPNLSDGMERLNSMYARRFNWRHGRQNHLFGERFHDELILDESHFLESCRYVVLNPVRAGICREAREYVWSSYLATAGRLPVPDFLTTDAILSRFGEPLAIAAARYTAFVADGAAKPAMPRRLPRGLGWNRRDVPSGRGLRSPGTSATRRPR